MTQQPVTQIADPGTTVTFSITAAGDEPLRYQWRREGVALVNGGRIGGADATTLTLGAIAWADAGYFDCVVSNDGGSTTSLSARLVVNPTLTVISGQGDVIPVAGATVFTSGTRVNIVAPPFVANADNTSRWVCTGWTAQAVPLVSSPPAGRILRSHLLAAEELGGNQINDWLAMDQPLVLTWHWKLQHKLFVKIDPAMGGTVCWDGTQAPQCSITSLKTFTVRNWFDAGLEVNLGAVTNPGHVFVSWDGDAVGSGPAATVIMDAPRYVTIMFQESKNSVRSWRLYE